MSNTAAEAKLRFLEASARHYASSAPETSAHLMAQCVAEAAESRKLQSRNQQEGICKACSSILIPGWTSRTSIIRKGAEPKASKVGSRKNVKSRSNQKTQNERKGLQKFLRIDCLICYRYEDKPLQEIKARSKHSARTPSKLAAHDFGTQLPHDQGDRSATACASEAQPSKPSAMNTGSKKRAKARKQGSLQAMLEKSKASASSSTGFGLDLLDLMKQG